MKLAFVFLLATLMFASPSLAGGYRYYNRYYYYPQTIVHEKYVIPIREIKFNEVKGLKILQDLDGNSYYEINGKILSIYNPQIKELITEKKEKDKIIIEKTTIQQ